MIIIKKACIASDKQSIILVALRKEIHMQYAILSGVGAVFLGFCMAVFPNIKKAIREQLKR
jgi:hypothetical protein